MSDLVPAVLVDGVSKGFELPKEHIHTLKEHVLHPLRRPQMQRLQALRDVSFAVQPGEFYGIVGRNGSGKSTLLKCLAGIYAADRGRIYVNGHMSTFIELGVGFNPDLAARDNVALNATMLGLSRREARRRFDAVIDFAELHDFVDLKLKNYSSGMMVRLAFAVMVQVDAEILLIDEVLAVGDAAFQQKCFDEFARLRARGATLLLVTHDMGAVERFCDRAMLLELGGVVEIGDATHVGNRYLSLNFSEQARTEQAVAASRGEEDDEPEEEGRPLGDGSGEILEAWFENVDGERASSLTVGERCAFVARVRFHRAVECATFAVELRNGLGHVLFVGSNAYLPRPAPFAAGEETTYRIDFTNLLAPDRYWASPFVQHRRIGGGPWIDRRDDLAEVVSTAAHASGALVEIPFEFSLERSGAATRVPR